MLLNIRYAEFNPLCPPDWRWRLAGQMTAEDVSHAEEDQAVVLAYRYLGAFKSCRSERDMKSLLRGYPALAQAHAVYRAGGSTKTALEARVVADEAPKDIAVRSQMSVAGVELFEEVFFDVRQHLNARDWVLCTTIGQIETAADDEQRRERFVKHLAYAGGPVVAELALHCLGMSGILPEELTLTNADRQRLTRQLALMERMIAERIPPKAMLRIAEIAFDEDLCSSCDYSTRRADLGAQLQSFVASSRRAAVENGVVVPVERRRNRDAG
ncbi:MAG: hypothetical protein DWQ34_24210 [Planctomycetota bacterium]|nr:MAG: hypothetical protein DWQ29_12865 [Planctomycetota bacterium]REJ87753.1 MAG: hypothetical protein DWQ34_24210 [Planctomycetota bacterium]REK27836.1 MAG: hypothetical protein DWQ41_06960 [Planctomycetota bacterium]REK40290.1 MAG: hypothetical protein DWQ45_00200 [Planctomycetota bacterium]